MDKATRAALVALHARVKALETKAEIDAHEIAQHEQQIIEMQQEQDYERDYKVLRARVAQFVKWFHVPVGHDFPRGMDVLAKLRELELDREKRSR